MSFDWGQFLNPAALFLGAGIACLILMYLDKGIAKASAGENAPAEDQGKLAKLQAELDAAKANQSKVAEVHAYARQLEIKVQELESLTAEPGSADSELRVKVLEKQLSEKADLESRLAVALQQLEDYKAKAEMFDTVVGNVPVAEAPVAPAPVFAEEKAPDPEPKPEQPMVMEEPPKPAPVEAKPAKQPEPMKEVAVAKAEAAPGITVVENQGTISGNASPVGATAPAMEERPALRIETSYENRDPLEKIEGIGQVYQTKLYDAGIKTFAQLAAASPSRITEVIEPQNWQSIDVMKWRREAALYASGEKS